MLDPMQLFKMEVGETIVFGPEYGDLDRIAALAKNVGHARLRAFTVEQADLGVRATRLPDPRKPAGRPRVARDGVTPTSTRGRILSLKANESMFIPHDECRIGSVRSMCSAARMTDGKTFRVTQTTQDNAPGTLVLCLDGAEDATQELNAPPVRDTTRGRIMALPVFGVTFVPHHECHPHSVRSMCASVKGTGRTFRVNKAVVDRVAGLNVLRVNDQDPSTPGPRAHKYPFYTTKPGDSFVVPAGATNIANLRVLGYRYGELLGLKFKARTLDNGDIEVACTARPDE